MKCQVLTLLSLALLAASEPELAPDLEAVETQEVPAMAADTQQVPEMAAETQLVPDQAAEPSHENYLNSYVGYEQNPYRPAYRFVSIDQGLKPVARDAPPRHINIPNYKNLYLGYGHGLYALEYDIGARSQNLNYDRELQIVSNWHNRAYLEQRKANQQYIGVVGLRPNQGVQAQEYSRYRANQGVQVQEYNRYRANQGVQAQEYNRYRANQGYRGNQVRLDQSGGYRSNQQNQYQLNQLQIGVGNNIVNEQNPYHGLAHSLQNGGGYRVYE